MTFGILMKYEVAFIWKWISMFKFIFQMVKHTFSAKAWSSLSVPFSILCSYSWYLFSVDRIDFHKSLLSILYIATWTLFHIYLKHLSLQCAGINFPAIVVFKRLFLIFIIAVFYILGCFIFTSAFWYSCLTK